MSTPIFKGEEILYKEIVTADRINLGYVAAIEYNDIIIISIGTKKEYRIPKSRIMRYNDAEVLLDVLSSELDRYQINYHFYDRQLPQIFSAGTYYSAVCYSFDLSTCCIHHMRRAT